ncbi:glycosyltransferase family 1 protein [Paenibacillus gorillae]|uniref:glycosyltransferase family 1 protein n=1 Tax=Paenibacillus gorillae TaxID=1243662 RepID=UPI0005A9011E|nr:glycosyltransferase family 1 protein [Paenibacillus gorillae]
MTQKIKVLHIVGKMHPGGIETLLMNVYRSIDRERFEFHFAVQSPEPAFYDDEIRALGGTIFVQPPPKNGIGPFRKQLLANMKEHGPYAAVHSHVFGFSGYVLKLAAQLGVPVRISHSHNTNDSKSSSPIRTLYRAYMRGLIRKNATMMLGCSRAACESLFGSSCWKDQRVAVFPNAISLAPYEALPEDRSELRRRFGANEEGPLLGHIGRFSRQKNHALLLDSFAAYLKKEPQAQLLLVGDGPLRGEMEHKAEELGIDRQVRFLGLRKDIPELLGALDGFVLPSLYEGLGIVLIEAQAAGVPCLVSEEVPREADLGLGMISRLPAGDTPQSWANGIAELAAGGLAATASQGLSAGAGDWNERAHALSERGYNIQASAARLERMYAG